MSKSSGGPHVPTMVVVGLGMVLIAALAAVAAWAWAHRKGAGPLLAGQRRRRQAAMDEDEGEVDDRIDTSGPAVAEA